MRATRFMKHTVEEPELIVLLPIKLTNGNDGRGNRWFNSAKRRGDIARQLALLGFQRTPFDYPVKIRITRVLGPSERLWDADSIGRGNAKELIDSLTELGWWHDDGAKWITSCDYRQQPHRRKDGPSVQIEVWKV